MEHFSSVDEYETSSMSMSFISLAVVFYQLGHSYESHLTVILNHFQKTLNT